MSDGERLVTPHDEIPLLDIIAGTDWTEPAEGTYATNGQTWARLLAMAPEERDKFLTMLQESASKGMTCYAQDHASQIHELTDSWIENRALVKYVTDGWIADRVRLKRALSLAHGWRQAARDFVVGGDR